MVTVRLSVLKGPDVRFGSKADMAALFGDVRFTPKADMRADMVHVCFVPLADMVALFDDRVG